MIFADNNSYRGNFTFALTATFQKKLVRAYIDEVFPEFIVSQGRRTKLASLDPDLVSRAHQVFQYLIAMRSCMQFEIHIGSFFHKGDPVLLPLYLIIKENINRVRVSFELDLKNNIAFELISMYWETSRK